MQHTKNIDQLSLFEKALALPRRSVSIVAYRGESHLVGFLYCALVCAIAGYVYFVGLSIMNVIAHREATLASESLQTEVATLEQEYFELAREVTLEAAAVHGLAKPVATVFVKRDSGVAVNISASGL